MSGGQQPIQIGSADLQDHKALTSKEFAFVKANGTSLKGRYFIINVVAAPDHKTRLGIIVSKRFNNKAVKRNRARRLIRECFRLLQHGCKEPIWIVIIARKMLHDASLQDVQKDFIKQLQNDGHYK